MMTMMIIQLVVLVSVVAMPPIAAIEVVLLLLWWVVLLLLAPVGAVLAAVATVTNVPFLQLAVDDTVVSVEEVGTTVDTLSRPSSLVWS